MHVLSNKKTLFWSIISLFLLVFFLVLYVSKLNQVTAITTDCAPGYEWIPSSGVGCVQTNCNNVSGAHWGYTQNCVCGSSGSEWENPADANQECYRPENDSTCPRCVYACVHNDESCPGLNNTTVNNQPTCVTECQKLIAGSKTSKVLEQKGVYPACSCLADINDEQGRLVKTIKQEGDERTILTFDASSGDLRSKEVILMSEERERVRKQLGFRYTKEKIDELLEDSAVNTWFSAEMQPIQTETNRLKPLFWWQHLVALFDHGFGSDAEFVKTYNYGRCGDSMQWLENRFADKLGLNGDEGMQQEAILSITGEKYRNLINHTAILVRPTGVENDQWAQLIQLLVSKSGGDGLRREDLNGIDPRLLQAKVIDPYYKKITTVEDFIRGWSVIRIS